MTRRLLLAVALAFLVLGAGQAASAFPGDDGAIVLVDIEFEPTAKYELFVANPDGSATDRITTDVYRPLRSCERR